MELKYYKNEFDKNGIIKINNFLEKKEISILKKRLNNLDNPQKGSNKSIIYYEKMGFFQNATRLINIIFYKNFAKQKKLNLIAKNFLNHKIQLYYIDTYHSEVSDTPVLDWHFDQAYSGRNDIKKNEFLNPETSAIKFFIYLSKTYSNNGCLSYINGSHKIAYFLKKLIFENKIEYKPYWKINQFLDCVKEKKNYEQLKNYLDEQLIKKFIFQAEKINQKFEYSYVHDYECESGDMLIFDEAGCHRGSKILYSDRYALRFLYRRDLT